MFQKIVVEAYSFDIPRDSSRSVSISLPKNGRINSSLEVTGGGNIHFRIYNEDRSIKYIEELFVTSLEFSFIAPNTGDFILSFDNFGWFVPSVTVSLSDVILAMEPYDFVWSPIFLLFDLSDVPPEATINSARLGLALSDSGESRYNLVRAFYCSETDWDEQAITYENAPLSESYLIDSNSFNVTGISIGHYCEWEIKPDVVRSRPTGKLTEIIAIVESESPTSAIRFFSRESESKPKLTIAYTYVSVSSSASPTFLIEGQNAAVVVGTDPSQTVGNIKVQYSTDQIEWFDIENFSGGSAHCVWTPSVTGQVYVRSLWEISWDDGSYYTLSSVSGLFIIPSYILILIPAIILGAIVGIYFWRKRKAS